MLLFASRNLNRSEPKANDTMARYSSRYLELAQMNNLSAAERAELAAYRRDWEAILPLGPVAR